MISNALSNVRLVFHSLFAICLVMLLATNGYSQDDDVVRVNTDLVILNVTVTDAAGQYVPGLGLADFKVFEDGKEIPLRLISSFSVHEAPFASVVLLDTSSSMEVRLTLARSAAIRFLDRLREEDVAAVYNFDSKVERVQEFSTGRDLAPMAYALHAKGMTRLNLANCPSLFARFCLMWKSLRDTARACGIAKRQQCRAVTLDAGSFATSSPPPPS